MNLVHNSPNEEAIEYLEHLLADAKSGEIQAIAVIVGYQGGEVDGGYLWDGFDSVALAKGALRVAEDILEEREND